MGAIIELMAQLPTIAKSHHVELTSFASNGADLSNYLKRLCKLKPIFVSTPSTPIIPPSGSIFNQNLAALEAVKDF